MTVNIGSSAQWRQVVGSSSIVVTDFYADWCGPCKVIAPTFESLSAKFSKPNRITFAKVNVDNQRDVAQQYGVSAMPTFVILRNGSVIETIKGANPPALTAAVEKAVKLAGVPPPGAGFGTPGRTLGGTSGGATAGAAAAPAARRQPARGSSPSWDLNGLINAVIIFFGLYFTSLLSFDPYVAAQHSKFNIKNPTGPAAPNSGSGGKKVGGGPKSSFKTLADLGSE